MKTAKYNDGNIVVQVGTEKPVWTILKVVPSTNPHARPTYECNSIKGSHTFEEDEIELSKQ